MDVINYFTRSFLEQLESTKHGEHVPIMSDLNISKDGKTILTLRIEDKFQSRQANIIQLFNGCLCFMILDSFIDSVFPEMEGKTIKYKYEKLPKNNNIEIMFSQIYRILKLYRNATVHHINGISITQKHLKINFSHNNIDYFFTITHKGIEIIEDMLLCYFYYRQINYSYYYKEYLLYSFYSDILEEIEAFNDEFMDSMSINSIKINRYERFNCNSINYEISN